MAFSREQRFRNAGEFIIALTPQKKPVGVMISVGVAVVLVGVMAVTLLPSLLDGAKVKDQQTILKTGDDAKIAEAVVQLKKFRPELRNSALGDPDAFKGLFDYFERRVRAAFDVKANPGRYDYAAAHEVLQEAKTLLGNAYDGSSRFTGLEGGVEKERLEEIPNQAERYAKLLQQRVLIPQQGADNVQGTLQIIARLQPDHQLLKDPALPGAFKERAQTAFNAKEYPLAQALVDAGLQLAPQAADGFKNVQDQLASARETAELARQVVQLESSLGPLAKATALEQFRARREDLNTLRRAAPQSSTLASVRAQLEQQVKAAVIAGLAGSGATTTQQQIRDAQAPLVEFADLLGDRFLQSQYASIEQAGGRGACT